MSNTTNHSASLLAGSSLAVCWYSRERSWIISTTLDWPYQMGQVPDGAEVWRYVSICTISGKCWCRWPFSLFLSHSSHFKFIFNPVLPQCAFWKTINSYFVDIAAFSIFSPNHILHLAARSRQSHRVWVKCFQHETRNSLTAIWLGRKVSEQRRRLWKSCNQQITMQNLANHWEETNSCIFVWSFTRYILRFSMQGINFNFAGRPN